jgi:hypothetical protein
MVGTNPSVTANSVRQCNRHHRTMFSIQLEPLARVIERLRTKRIPCLEQWVQNRTPISLRFRSGCRRVVQNLRIF